MPSKNQVNKAGKILRARRHGDVGVSNDQVEAALGTLRAFRASHRASLERTVASLRQALRFNQVDATIAARLKRERAIMAKLDRQPTMQLATMRDIAGCRSTIADIATIRRLEASLRAVHPGLRAADYTVEPRSSGYRGLHLIVTHDRPVEVQLRTPVMHHWAMTVELVGFATGQAVKNGDGPDALLDALRTAALEAAELEKAGEPEPAMEMIDSVGRDLADQFGKEHR